MEKLIPIINQLQEVFSTSGSGSGAIQLPQIVVVGEQSAGKSSVLESLVGRTCLPRGNGIVTRCPIVLQLIQTGDQGDHDGEATDRPGVDEYCEFPHLPEGEKIITDFGEIVTVINTEVDKRAGTNKGIIKDELIMKIHSPNVINLTVVDLPGMVKNPTGDQPLDIERQVEDLLRSYIKNPNSIILAVSSASNDIATSGSLKLAKELDPQLDRTIAVITKLDLMDRGTNATEVLTGDILNVKLGIVGVVNRSYEDIRQNKTIIESITNEEKFLSENYPMIADRNGSPYLKSRLQALLLDHIKQCLPQLQSRLSTMKMRAVDEMKVLGEDAPKDKSLYLRKIIEKFCEAFKAAITGRKFRNIERESLIGVAKLKQIFEDVLADKLNSVDPLVDLQNEFISNTVANSRPLESGIVVAEVAFQDLVRKQIRLLEQPILDCATSVHEEILDIVEVCMRTLDAEMRRFPKVKSAIAGVVCDLLQQQNDVAQAELSKYVDYQASFITMNQKEFSEEIKELQQAECYQEPKELETNHNTPYNPNNASLRPQVLFSNQINNKDVVSSHELNKSDLAKCEMMRRLVSKYFETVKSDIRNFWPKVVYKNVIYFMEEETHDKLIDKLYTTEKIEQLVTENSHIAVRRKQVAKQLQELQKASKIVATIRGVNF